jgi:aminopeptidase-like protein
MKLYRDDIHIDLNTIGCDIHEFIAELYPLCRSITGNGLRETLRLIKNYIPLTLYEIPTGTQVLDWTVPKEWNIRDAYIKNAQGERIVDFQQSNLHVVHYSVPIHKALSLEALKPHLFSLPQYPDWVPYRHAYYQENWGFCLSHRQLMMLQNDRYEVCIDASLEDGSLTYGEYYLEGKCEDEVLITCHTCHRSLCNDNLSGIAIAVFLACHLRSISHKLSYRFLFHPTTIGSIAWLASNEDKLCRIKHGLVLACVGDPGKSTYKKSRRGDAEIDRAMLQVLKDSGEDYEILEFSPYGYDERQFCSPGFNLPMGCLMRTPNGRFPQYHTSADNLDFVEPVCLADSFMKCLQVFDVLENNETFVNQNPKGEPQLGRRGLYRPLGERHEPPLDQLAVLWVLNFSDGTHSLLNIAERAGIRFETIRRAADALLAHSLLKVAPDESMHQEEKSRTDELS